MARPRVGLQHPDADRSCDRCHGFGTVIDGSRARFCGCTTTPAPASVTPDHDAAVVVGSCVIDTRRGGGTVAHVLAVIGDRALLTSGSNPRVTDLVAVA